MTGAPPAMPPLSSVELGRDPAVGEPADPELERLAAEAAEVAGSADRALDLARSLSEQAPAPGEGRTVELWRMLATLAASDLTAARVAEAHLDALAIQHQAGIAPEPGATWGVFAAEAPGTRLQAEPNGDGFVLTGVKPWCSLAGRLDRALVTAHTTEVHRRLFSVDLRDPSVAVESGSWHARGLVEVDSGPVTFDGTPASPVGADEWYLRRPGFAWGGIGVAACWYGGAVGVARALVAAASRREPDQIAAAHLGAVAVALAGARRLLEHAARQIDAGEAEGSDGATLALTVRTAVAGAAELVLQRAGHALGPAPLTFDESHARRVADLTVYLRQHHAERDEASLGKALLESGRPLW